MRGRFDLSDFERAMVEALPPNKPCARESPLISKARGI